jgi:hypothetical protein
MKLIFLSHAFFARIYQFLPIKDLFFSHRKVENFTSVCYTELGRSVKAAAKSAGRQQFL